MDAAGYLYKKVVSEPGFVPNPSVNDIYSVSGCLSAPFMDYIPKWKHNGYWFFDSPDIMEGLAVEAGVSLAEMKLFFYRVYSYQWNEDSESWDKFSKQSEFPTIIREPTKPRSEGFDVVTFSGQTNPECSALSCNDLCEYTVVNSHCLFRTFDEAKRALEEGFFRKSERGPFRIIEVLSP